MRIPSVRECFPALVAAFLLSGSAPSGAEGEVDLPRIEVYPDEIQARLEQRERDNLRQPREVGGSPFALVIELLALWPDDVVTVSFNGGDSQLYEEIAREASLWSEHGSIRFDFGNEDGGPFREWSPSDTTYASDIRISFDQPGYWSLVGTDSVDSSIVDAGQASLNLSGFQSPLSEDDRGTVLHEFGHALGFHHEHQTPQGGCDSEFRWEDDPDGTAGIYTLLAGHPNYWPKWKVDHNLRQLPASDAYLATPHDPASIMHYSFPAWMFRWGTESHCFTDRNNVLSEADIAAASTAYPPVAAGLRPPDELRRDDLLRDMLALPDLPERRKEFLRGQLERIQR